MDENHELWKLLEPPLKSAGYEIVRLKWMGGEKYKTLQIMIEPLDGRGVTVEDCETASHTVSAILDVEDIIEGAYRLEVSSPGIDRPLTRKKDFETYQAFEMKFETREPIDGRKRFRGKIKSLNEDGFEFAVSDDKKTFNVPFHKITEAKLILTDELIKHVTEANKGRAGVIEGGEMDV